MAGSEEGLYRRSGAASADGSVDGALNFSISSQLHVCWELNDNGPGIVRINGSACVLAAVGHVPTRGITGLEAEVAVLQVKDSHRHPDRLARSLF